MAFKIGDTVRVAALDSADKGLPVKVGEVGVVAKVISTGMVATYLVRLGSLLPHHSVTSEGLWRAYEYQLVPAQGKTSASVELGIDQYRFACEQFEAAELALEKAKQAIVDARLNLRDALHGET